MGVRTRRVKLAVYVIAGALSGIAAILLVARLGAAEPAANTTYLLNAIAAVVLGGVALQGGRGSVLGPVVGALLLTALTNGLTLLGVSQFYQPLAVGFVVVAAAPGTDAPSDALLVVDRVAKSFGNVRALRDVSLWLGRGQITALIGDNGAGKSTLVRTLSGVHPPDSGELRFDGTPVRFTSPEEARSAGIETVHQNLALVDDLTVWQNLFLGRERIRRVAGLPLLDRAAMREQAGEMLSRLSVNVPPAWAKVRRLSGGQRQAVAIARAAGWGSKLVIMDEPTAALGVQETARVEELIARLRDEGMAILLISHNFDQVMRLADRVWVMRAGGLAAGRATADTDAQELVALVTGARAD
ncbi:ABC transporter ATP-binding protein [Marinitenerispora sediminis]|nr:ABC transporter ATP-binding protein [Marinitenerispora sediminis]